jgi:ABC-type transport system involved in multi-copper enzyme maturation permease subunit
MYRTLVIARHTFRESIVQPIYSLLIGIGSALMFIFAMLPFFTLGEDSTMFKSVALDIVLLLVLLTTLFATSKSIYDEIEDRTMLTLMSKPVRKWEVLLGKYLGIIAGALLAIVILGVVISGAIYWRVPNDYQLQVNSLDDLVLKQIADFRLMHIMGMIPSLLLVWLQIAALAAIGVALSVRFSLVVNLPAVILFYVAGNLTRFLGNLDKDSSIVTRGLAWVATTVVPFLQVFDFRQHTIYREVRVPGTQFMDVVRHPNAVDLGMIWGYFGVASLYALGFAIFALAAGLLLFENRELGGAEG